MANCVRIFLFVLPALFDAPKLGRAHACVTAENTSKIIGTGKTGPFGDLLDGALQMLQILAGVLQPYIHQIAYKGFPRFLANLAER